MKITSQKEIISLGELYNIAEMEIRLLKHIGGNDDWALHKHTVQLTDAEIHYKVGRNDWMRTVMDGGWMKHREGIINVTKYLHDDWDKLPVVIREEV